MKNIFFITTLLLLASMQGCIKSKQTTVEPVIQHALDTVPRIDWYCSSIVTKAAKSGKTDRAMGARGKFWPVGTTLKVGFIQPVSAATIATVKSQAEEWLKYANIKFSYPSVGPYDVRIGFNPGAGAWSYVGTDNKLVGQTYATMNLGWISPDATKHEFGHMLGLLHEQQNPQSGICWDENEVIKDLSGPPNNWNLATIRFNVLDKADPANVITTAWDKNSIMHYPIRASWTCNKVAITPPGTISQFDKDFIAIQYPGVIVPPNPTGNVTLTPSQVNEITLWLNQIQTESDSFSVHVRNTTKRIKTVLGK